MERIFLAHAPLPAPAAEHLRFVQFGGGRPEAHRGLRGARVLVNGAKSTLSAHSRARGNPGQQAPESATLDPRFRGDERRLEAVNFAGKSLRRLDISQELANFG